MVQKVYKQGSGVGRNQDGRQGAVTDGKWDPWILWKSGDWERMWRVGGSRVGGAVDKVRAFVISIIKCLLATFMGKPICKVIKAIITYSNRLLFKYVVIIIGYLSLITCKNLLEWLISIRITGDTS